MSKNAYFTHLTSRCLYIIDANPLRTHPVQILSHVIISSSGLCLKYLVVSICEVTRTKYSSLNGAAAAAYVLQMHLRSLRRLQQLSRCSRVETTTDAFSFLLAYPCYPHEKTIFSSHTAMHLHSHSSMSRLANNFLV